MPTEDFIYLGDTARLPYGTKSADTVARYSLQCAGALVKRGIGCLVVACNTASASALDILRSRYPGMPIFGVIEPSAAAAVAASRSQHIAVIGTEGTVDGGAYQAAIRRLNPATRVVAQACSLFVAMAEEGWTEGPILAAVAHRYLDPIFGDPIFGAPMSAAPVVGEPIVCEPVFFAPHACPDTLVLGCTHFPALTAAIRAVLPGHVHIIDSAATTAAAVRRQWPSRDVREQRRGSVRWLATDGASRFARVGHIFFGQPLLAGEIEVVDL